MDPCGSPTGEADSGTIEEIERAASDGKPIMLYFSKVKQDPSSLDIDQLTSLREFKQKTFPKALVEQYSTQIDFRDKLFRQLDAQARGLLSKENIGFSGISPTTDIVLEFADPENGERLGKSLELDVKIISIEGLDKLPNFTDSSSEPALGLLNYSNKDYYRECSKVYSTPSVLKADSILA